MAADAKANVITSGKKVSINYTLTIDGKVVDSNKGKEPLAYTQGSHQIVPGLENGLEGIKVGDKKKITVKPEEGYGPVNPQALIEVDIAQIPKDAKPGMVLTTRGKQGEPVHATFKEVKKDKAVLDFNHPLAGKTLNFDIEVVSIT